MCWGPWVVPAVLSCRIITRSSQCCKLSLWPAELRHRLSHRMPGSSESLQEAAIRRLPLTSVRYRRASNRTCCWSRMMCFTYLSVTSGTSPALRPESSRRQHQPRSTLSLNLLASSPNHGFSADGGTYGHLRNNAIILSNRAVSLVIPPRNRPPRLLRAIRRHLAETSLQ